MPTTKTAPERTKAPVLGVTRYDLVTSFMIAAVVGLVLAVTWLSVVWVTNRPAAKSGAVPLELVEIPGGVADGAVDETLRLESPEEAVNDPSLAETLSEESEIEETLDNVIELAELATNFAQEQFEVEVEHTGQPGSATGTGRRALGDGTGESGLPREQRWFVRFSDRGTLSAYARQLDFFGIELGALIDGNKMAYLSRLSKDPLTKRTSTNGAEETRLYMTWQGGGRRKADVELFTKAGVDVFDAILFHFYPRETEELLARLERDFANRPVEEIRRTYFVVRPERGGYRFQVTRQSYFR